jgi:hypothetical protein
MNDIRTFARFVLLGLILIGSGYTIAALSAPSLPSPAPVQATRLVCVTPEIASNPDALCALLVRR